MEKSLLRLCKPSHNVPYSARNFYQAISINDSLYDRNDMEHALARLWHESSNIDSLNPDYFPKVSIKTTEGEFVQQLLTLKSQTFFLKLVGDHFVLIHQNQRKVIPCSRSQ